MKRTTNYNLYKPEPTDAVNSNIPNADNMDIIDANLKDVSDLADLVDQGLTALAATVAGKVSKAGDTMSGALNMGANKITSLAYPVAASDAANKNYVDAKASDYLPLAGGTMDGDIDMDSLHKITGILSATITDNTDATNKLYVDNAVATRLSLAGGTMAGDIDMNGTHKITGISTPLITNNSDAANKKYVDDAVSGAAAAYLPLSGGTMVGDIAMDGNNLEINDGELVFQTIAMHENGSGILKIGEDAASAVTHIYGETILDALNMNGHAINDVATPTAGTDAANKEYVDGFTVNFVLTGSTMTTTTTWNSVQAAVTSGKNINAKQTVNGSANVYVTSTYVFAPNASITFVFVTNAQGGSTELRFIRFGADGVVNYYTRSIS